MEQAKNNLDYEANHVGLIPDGARRWAQKHTEKIADAYLSTMVRLGEYIHVLFNVGVQQITIYLASKDNIKRRSEDEVDAFLKQEIHFIEKIAPPILEQWNATCQIIGDSGLLPDTLNNLARDYRSRVPQGTRNINLLIGYDSWDEIVSCLATDGRVKLESLWINSNIDVVIRTGGHHRLSGFAPLQSRYAEIVFLDSLFLDTTEVDILNALTKANRALRNFGS